MAPIYIRIPQFEVMSPREDLRFHLWKLNCGGRSGRSGRSQRKVAAATVASKAWLRDVAWLRGKAPFFVRQKIRRTSLPFQVFESFMYFQQAFWTGLDTFKAVSNCFFGAGSIHSGGRYFSENCQTKAFKIFERLNPLVPWMPLEMLPFNHPLARLVTASLPRESTNYWNILKPTRKAEN